MWATWILLLVAYSAVLAYDIAIGGNGLRAGAIGAGLFALYTIVFVYSGLPMVARDIEVAARRRVTDLVQESVRAKQTEEDPIILAMRRTPSVAWHVLAAVTVGVYSTSVVVRWIGNVLDSLFAITAAILVAVSGLGLVAMRILVPRASRSHPRR